MNRNKIIMNTDNMKNPKLIIHIIKIIIIITTIAITTIIQTLNNTNQKNIKPHKKIVILVMFQN